MLDYLVGRINEKLETAKRSSTLQVLFKVSRLLNERALATLPLPEDLPRPRPSHTALFPHVDLEGGTRLTELADRLGISKQAISQLVDDLEAMGVMARIPDPQDGRAKRVVFTDLGQQQIFLGLAHLEALERLLTKELGTGVMDRLREPLLALHDHLEPKK